MGSLIVPVLSFGFVSAQGAYAFDGCTLTPEQEEGPFYIPHERFRSSIAEGRSGLPLALHIRLFDAVRCVPMRDAAIDIWHCDALGVYSGFAATLPSPPGPRPPGGGPPPHFGPPPGSGPPPPNAFDRGGGGPPHMAPANKLTFLRGIQVTNENGTVRFSTIVPGFYEGRVNHIHLKVHLDASAQARNKIAHTGQIFFPEAVASAISSKQPYDSHRIVRTSLHEDHVFMGQNGRASMATLRRSKSERGYVASLTIMVDRRSVPA
jgi:protocatechuate 3,4-dioxygenase beta subunit